MKKKEVISPYQMFVLSLFFCIGTSLLVTPANITEKSGQDAWAAAIIGSAAGFVILLFYIFLASRFPKLTFVQLSERILGKWLGKAVTLLFVAVSLLFTGTLMHYSGLFLKLHMMPQTPMVVLNALLAGVVIMGAMLGMETIARSAEVFLLAFGGLFVLLIVAVAPQAKLERLQPVFEHGPGDIISSSIPLIEVSAMNAIVLLMIFPALLDSVKKGGRALMGGYLIGIAIIILLTTLCVAVLGASYTTTLEFPGYELAKRINIGNFIQRIEGIMSVMWIMSLFVKAAIYFHAAITGTAYLFGRDDPGRLALPLGAAALVLSVTLYPDTIYLMLWNDTTGLFLSVSLGIFIPVFLGIIYLFRRKTLKRERRA